MTGSARGGNTTKFVLLAVRREAAYWTPATVATELCLRELVDPSSQEALDGFRDEVLRGLVGRAAERFWASDAVTPANAAAIRSACQALHNLTLEQLAQTASELGGDGAGTAAGDGRPSRRQPA